MSLIKSMRTFDDRSDSNKPGYIYLIHAKGTRPRRYKIGLTTRDVWQRFNELNSSQSPYPLELLASIATDNVTETEGYLHDKYSFQRRHGEWFEFNNRELKGVLREFDRLENGDRGWFRLPSISLPSLPTVGLPKMPELNADIVGLLIAGIGTAWLMVLFSGWLRTDPTPRREFGETPLLQSSNSDNF
jgi:hypothetical protein